MSEVKCKDHPAAPHGFDRNGSHNADRYVCDCEHWHEPTPDELARAAYLAGWLDGMSGDPDSCGKPEWEKRREDAIAEAWRQGGMTPKEPA